MPTVNAYFSNKEMYGLLMEADKQSEEVTPLIRQIVKEWLQKKGYEVD